MTEPQILIAERDDKLLRLMTLTLRLKGIRATTAHTGAMALQALKLTAPDLVVAELDMPDLHGFDLLRRVRALPGYESLPFVFLARDETPTAKAKALLAGEVSMLRKPFAIEELLRRIEDALERSDPDSLGPSDLRGTIQETGLPELLRRFAAGARSGKLTLRPERVQPKGWIHLRQGTAIQAEFGLLNGVEALLALLPHEDGTWEFAPELVTVPPLIVEETLALVAEGRRMMKEGVLRRIDPGNAPAVRAFTRLVAEQRRQTPLSGTGRASILSTGRIPTSADAAVTDEHAPGFVSDEIEEIEAEHRTRAMAPGTIVVKPLPEREISETAVALVDDTIAEMEAPAPPSEFVLDASDAMDLFENLLYITRNELGAVEVQISTRSGRVIASNIRSDERRTIVAELANEAMAFAVDESGHERFASLDAGRELHLLVFEIDHLRLLAMVFERKPHPAEAEEILSPVLELYRIAR